MALGFSSELKGIQNKKKIKNKNSFCFGIIYFFFSFLNKPLFLTLGVESGRQPNETKLHASNTRSLPLSLSLLFFFFELSLLTHFTRGLPHSLFTHKSGFLLGKILVLVVFSYEIRCFFSEHFGDYFGRIFVAEIGYRDCMTYFFFFFMEFSFCLMGCCENWRKSYYSAVDLIILMIKIWSFWILLFLFFFRCSWQIFIFIRVLAVSWLTANLERSGKNFVCLKGCN